MTMPRLTSETQPLTNFKKCQLCGFEDDDICEFRLWVECDELDKPEPRNILVVCRHEGCRKRIDEHPRLYCEVPWGKGLPGYFVLICGDCKHRVGFGCKHPHLKANGGEGLEVFINNPIGVRAHLCFHDGTGQQFDTSHAVDCEGLHMFDLEPVYRMVASGEIRKASDILFEMVNDLLLAGEFKQCNDLILSADLDQLDTNLLVGLLAITCAAKEHLPGRPGLVTRVEKKLLELAPDRITGLMAGLR